MIDLQLIDCFSARIYDEKGHRGMTLAFYLTGKERSGVVGVKVQKVLSIFSNGY